MSIFSHGNYRRSKFSFISRIIVLALVTAFSVSTKSQASAATEDASPRYLAVISDLHMGLGKVDGEWHPYEDFRWPNALKTFLEEINHRGEGQVDLVIAGDFLELWQIPDDIPCKGDGPSLGCSIAEIEKITSRVISAHSGKDVNAGTNALESLRAFSELGDNKLHIIPGNHDAALMIPSVWRLLFNALGANKERVKLVGSLHRGVWTSDDGRVVIEHGHQMGADLNKYANWPTVHDAKSNLMERVQGELNVQKIFNDVERNYPVIDNLSPEVKGAWYRMQDRGAWGTVADLARLMTFLLFETSLKHKGGVLGDPTENLDGLYEWDLEHARTTLQYKVLVLALPETDVVREMVLKEPPSEDVGLLISEINRQVSLLSDDELSHLCDQLALRSETVCKQGSLGAAAQKIFMSRARVKRKHLRLRENNNNKMNTFIYGHTHHLEEEHRIEIYDHKSVKVFNTGAFQRLIDDNNYQRLMNSKYPEMDLSDGIENLDLQSDFEPCYTVVLAPFIGGFYRPTTWRWYAEETGDGKLLEVGDIECES